MQGLGAFHLSLHQIAWAAVWSANVLECLVSSIRSFSCQLALQGLGAFHLSLLQIVWSTNMAKKSRIFNVFCTWQEFWNPFVVPTQMDMDFSRLIPRICQRNAESLLHYVLWHLFPCLYWFDCENLRSRNWAHTLRHGAPLQSGYLWWGKHDSKIFFNAEEV